jgi:hypothetical protein
VSLKVIQIEEESIPWIHEIYWRQCLETEKKESLIAVCVRVLSASCQWPNDRLSSHSSLAIIGL